jgi:hypothetical protein
MRLQNAACPLMIGLNIQEYETRNQIDGKDGRGELAG